MDENRFQRLEDKVDTLKQDVSELKLDMRHHIKVVEEHVAGDKKIINQLTPILEKLPSIIQIVEDYQFTKQLQQRRIETVKNVTTKLGLVGLILGILVSLTKLI